MQEHSAVAGYWHNPFDEEEYKKFNVFLPDINNENEVKVEYKERFSQLNLLVLVIFKKDTFIVPYQSGAFGYFKSGDEKGTILSMEETELYKQVYRYIVTIFSFVWNSRVKFICLAI